MSELKARQITNTGLRLSLLATVSSLALVTASSVASAGEAGSDHSTVWIELGGQLEKLDGGQEPFAPPFLYPTPSFVTVSPASVQRLPRYSFGDEGKITFAPNGSDWTFSAAIRYGRSNLNKHIHQSTPVRYTVGTVVHTAQIIKDFIDLKTHHNESHAVLDFQAGRDIGIGLLGRHASSSIDFGVRIAQFNSKSSVRINEIPDYYRQHTLPIKYPLHHHSYFSTLDATRSFRGIGPSVAWNASVPLVGTEDTAQFAFEGGINGAVLFGRQRAATSHKTVGYYHHTKFLSATPVRVTQYTTGHTSKRSRSVVIPNVGAFAGISLKFPSASVSLGYRGDFFFGAIDGGIDDRKTYDRSFYGPFATIKIGLGG